MAKFDRPPGNDLKPKSLIAQFSKVTATSLMQVSISQSLTHAGIEHRARDVAYSTQQIGCWNLHPRPEHSQIINFSSLLNHLTNYVFSINSQGNLICASNNATLAKEVYPSLRLTGICHLLFMPPGQLSVHDQGDDAPVDIVDNAIICNDINGKQVRNSIDRASIVLSSS